MRRSLLLLSALSSLTLSGQQTYLVNTIAGYVNDWGDGAPAIQARFGSISALTTDAAGNVYLADTGRVHKIALDGATRTIAGNGVPGQAGDGGPAIFAETSPNDIAVDANGILYIAETSPPRLRKVQADGTIVSVFVPPASAGIMYLALDTAGELYLSEGGTISKVNPEGSLAKIVSLSESAGLAVDKNRNLFVAMQTKAQILKIDPSGNQTIVAGGGSSSQDGITATQAALQSPIRVAVDPAGNVYIAEGFSNGYYLSAPGLKKVDSDGVITSVAATGTPGAPFCCVLGIDPGGSLYALSGDTNNPNEIWRFASGGAPQLFAGGGIGDGGPANRALLTPPAGLALDGQGNIYVADPGNNRVRKIDRNSVITTVVGTGIAGFGGDGGPAGKATLNGPQGVTFDSMGNLYISDTANNRIRKIDKTGTITTVAGTGSAGFFGDGTAATSAGLNAPIRTAFDASGDLYIVDQGNVRIRMVSKSGIISTVAGNGINEGCCLPDRSPLGDGGPAIGALLRTPGGIAFDAVGNLYITEIYGARIRKVNSAGIISTAFSNLSVPIAIALDVEGNFYVADFASISRYSPAGKKTLLAGSPTFYGNNAGGVPGPEALFGILSDVVLEANGNILSADEPIGLQNEVSYIRELSPANIFSGTVFNGASGQLDFLSPGEIVSIGWANLGPQVRVNGVPGSDGRFPTLLAGTQVLFNGIAAPILNEDAQQVTVVVPYGLAGMTATSLQVAYMGQMSNTIGLPLQPATPGLFMPVLNADSTANSTTNPAAKGSEVAIFATGAGLMSPAVPDGTVTQGRSVPVNPVSVQIGGMAAEVLYLGAAPGLVAGVLQVNVRVPAAVASGNIPIVLTVAGADSQAGATISVR
jgi:uncharacterized protein (TIGR03437 family)